ncbi:hypothetical protein COLO4_17434 [Corchorus olitorius]|uniref:Wall-associated receptor kinase galacturonan-binding domain-containing protein n=1 Tax=Corchorus olitorius TaxID=93759 RepID=A0A1R3JCT4_9ROSI|nr:hypothetical protein COLO4_17434 [Corchorus olitorius]
MAALAFLFLILIIPNACLAATSLLENKDCSQSSVCGNLTIHFPFRLKTQPKCNNTDFRAELECDNHNRTVLVIPMYYRYHDIYEVYHVKEISYSDYWMRLTYPSLDDGDNCALPRTLTDPFSTPSVNYDTCGDVIPDLHTYSDDYLKNYLVNCSRPIKSPFYVNASRCTNTGSSSYFYFLDGRGTPYHEFSQFCTVIDGIRVQADNITALSTSDIYELLLMGFEVSWDIFTYTTCDKPSISQIIHWV